MIKSQPDWLRLGFELGISQIESSVLPLRHLTRWRSFCSIEYHHVNDFAVSMLKRKISSLSMIFTLI